jgi:hypothetical protein
MVAGVGGRVCRPIIVGGDGGFVFLDWSSTVALVVRLILDHAPVDSCSAELDASMRSCHDHRYCRLAGGRGVKSTAPLRDLAG